MRTQLDDIMDKLRASEEVDAAFLTGSSVSGKSTELSDTDLVIILKRNTKDIRSVYTFIDGKFADIFFFDVGDIDRISSVPQLEGNSMDAILASWLIDSEIKFDKSGKTTAFKEKLAASPSVTVAAENKFSSWQMANYNLIRNRRYFKANKADYSDALELCLSYSVIQLITTYFALRNVPWRGEKNAIKYLKMNDPAYWELAEKYFAAGNLKERMTAYEAMTPKTFTSDYRTWTEREVVAVAKKESDSLKRQKELADYWRELTSGGKGR